MARRSRESRTATYWLHNDRGVLLYVGVAADPAQRWKQHEHDKPWWPHVALRTIEWFPTLAEAQAAETKSIKQDRPMYNSLGIASAVRDGDISSWPTVSMMTAKERLHRYVDSVADGGTPVIIARRGHPLAVLVSYHQLQREAALQ